MIDFTDCPVNPRIGYGGANGSKLNITYEGVSYMLKFPSVSRRNGAMSYTNGCVSEYLACHIFSTLGFSTQETLLGTYTTAKGKEKLVVACKDFTTNGKRLMEFAHLKNTCVDSEQNGYGTELSSIMEAVEEQPLVEANVLRDFFWDMFIADAFLGNFDRHNGNWGLLIEDSTQTVQIAPIYDCGSCLYPQMDAETMLKVMNDEDEINKRIYEFPTSAVMEDNKKINYFDFISSQKNADCCRALKRVAGRIDFDKIHRVIEETPGITELQKRFYKMMLLERKEKIIDYSMNKLLRDCNLFV